MSKGNTSIQALDKFFYTDPETRLVHLFVRNSEIESAKVKKLTEENQNKKVKRGLNRADTLYYDDFIYFPESWETISQSQIEDSRRQFTRSYLFWGLMNKNVLVEKNIQDAAQTFTVFKDIIYNSLLMGVTAFFLNSFMRKMDPPIFDFWLFSDKRFQPKHLRYFFLSSTLIGMQYKLYSGHFRSDALFDTAFRYKEQVAPGQFFSPNCEHLLKE